MKQQSSRGVAYKAIDVPGDAFIHPSSLLFHRTPPDWIVFQDVVESSRVWMKGIDFSGTLRVG